MTTLRTILLALLATMIAHSLYAADGEPYNIRFIQRPASGEPGPLDYQGSDYPFHAMGFDALGVFAPLSITQLLTDGSVTSAKLADGAVTAAKVGDGSITNVKVAAGAAIDLTKLAQRVGTTWAATHAAPITANPYSPVWTTETLVVPYGATGTINLPAVATYNRAVLILIPTVAGTVTVDPSGSEQVVVNNVAQGAGVADTITNSAGIATSYACDSGRWIKLAGGGSAVGAALLSAANVFTANQAITGNLSVSGTITGATISGNLSGSTSVPGSAIVGPLADNLDKGQYTSAKAPTWTATPLAATTGAPIVIDTNAAYTTIILNEAAEEIQFNGVPPEGRPFMVYIKAHSVDCAVTTPSYNSEKLGTNRLGFTIRQNKDALVTFWRTATAYWGYEPLEMSDLPLADALTLSDLLEVNQGGASKRASLAEVKKGIRVGTKRVGTITSGATASPVALDWEQTDTIVYNVGGNATHNAPLASTVADCAIVYQFTASGVVTFNPNDADFVRRGDTNQADGVSITITGTPGQMFIILSDGTNWTTVSGTATVAAGS